MRHMAKAAAAAERAGVPISALLKSRDDSASAGGAPEAGAQHEKHACIRAQALSPSGPEQDKDVHEDPSRISDLHALRAVNSLHYPVSSLGGPI